MFQQNIQSVDEEDLMERKLLVDKKLDLKTTIQCLFKDQSAFLQTNPEEVSINCY